MGAALVGVAAVVVLCGCAARDEQSVTLYLKQHLGAEGPPGQIAPVLEPVGRERRPALPPEVQALVQLRQGPTPDERARGFGKTVDPSTRFLGVEIRGGTAFVDVAGKPLDFYGVAAVVYTLTELPGVERVRVCCLHRHDGSPISVHTRTDWGGWRGTPCALRAENPCLRDR